MLAMGLSFLIPSVKVDAAVAVSPVTIHAEQEIVPYADVIVTKYRTIGERLQYRRWNQTRGYWVDPYWIDV